MNVNPLFEEEVVKCYTDGCGERRKMEIAINDDVEEHPLISVIVPVYNAEKFVEKCLESICNQTYKNFEVIVVDDGSTDGSGSICDRFANNDSRFRVLHQRNQGISAAQNHGLDASQGEYIAFADNDDILDAKNLELLLRALLRTRADIAKARWKQFGISETSEIQRIASVREFGNPLIIHSFDNALSAYESIFLKSQRLLWNGNNDIRYFNEANWCRLYKRSLWKNVRFPEGHFAQDVFVAGELYSQRISVVDVDKPLYYYLQSPESVTHGLKKFGYYHDSVAAAVNNFRISIENGIVPKRSYYTIRRCVTLEGRAVANLSQAEQEQYAHDVQNKMHLFHLLSFIDRLKCEILSYVADFELFVYLHRIANKK